MLSKFEEQLNALNYDLTIMGSMCEKAIASSARSFLLCDLEMAKEVSEISEEIDKKEREIENECLKMLLSQQPVARDLRVISSALKLVYDMERIGDNSADIAEIVYTAKISPEEDLSDIREMAEATIKMVRESIEAFCKKDINIAKSIIKYDDVVDDYFESVKSRLIKKLSKTQHESGEYILDILMIAKYLERIGDHAVNIAKWVIFSITAKKPD